MFRTRWTRLAIGVMFSLLAGSAAGNAQAVTLIGRAVLPADTFSVGPTSGQFISSANGRVPPFLRHQPVQGFSVVLRAEDGAYLAMPDNGFGAKANSGDFVLAVYRLTPDFATRSRGTGTIGVTLQYNLRDPDHRIGFRIVADGETYPGSASTLGVLNDNNYPFSSGRNPGRPDDNEFILIRLDAPLPIDSRVGPEEDDEVGQDDNGHGQH